MTQDRLLPRADLLQNPDSGDASYLVSVVALAGFSDPALWTQRVFGHEGNRLRPLFARALKGSQRPGEMWRKPLVTDLQGEGDS